MNKSLLREKNAREVTTPDDEQDFTLCDEAPLTQVSGEINL